MSSQILGVCFQLALHMNFFKKKKTVQLDVNSALKELFEQQYSSPSLPYEHSNSDFLVQIVDLFRPDATPENPRAIGSKFSINF